MADLSLYLFDDEIGRSWHPFALTRPVGELLFGVMTLRERAERVFGAACRGHLTADHLVGFSEAGAAPVVAGTDPPREAARLFLLSRFVPEWPPARTPPALAEGPVRAGSGEVVGWHSPPGADNPPTEFLLRPAADSGGEADRIDGELLGRPWNLVTRNPDRIARDIPALHPGAGRIVLPAGAYHWGDHPLVIDPSARVEPGAVFDLTHGPIWLDRDSHVRALTRLVGPAYVGPGSTVLGGPVEAVSIGPVCRVRGELAESVCLGYVNKQHDGHMGHAYLGRWVNLGAETTNSDLKNNYGTIRLWTPEGEVDSGEVKMGSLVGDHVKTGIGLLLNTGTVIGAGSNLYGSEMPPTHVAPFSWGTGGQLVEYRLDKFLQVAERSMSRRGVELEQSVREQLARAWKVGRAMIGTETREPR
jgi:UDP-N-acetylglucosamine diphosphorylase / glucose-1-phosphate thymidylyltransferase / UDP-N-acetylgalactosamine diphosphorylase / glucosamine-1-phosphate N-acetyltransferase / galactosamine-1-phosphate N-acetyltransferase